MGFFDFFTGGANNLGPEINAIQGATDQANQFYGTGESAATGQAGATQNAINNYLQGGTSALSNYIGAGASGLGNYTGAGAGALNSYLSSALAPSLYNFGSTAAPGQMALGNALGLNGAQGNATATQSFWNNPAIQSQLQQGGQTVMRNAAAAGGGNLSGATLGALNTLGQNTASQGWNNYVSQLNPYLNFSQGTAGNIGQYGTAAGTAAASLYGGAGNTYASLFGGGANTGAGLYTGAGNQTVSSQNNLINALTGLYSNQAQTNAAAGGAISNDYLTQAAAENQSNANLAGFGLGALKLGTSLIPSDERIKDDIKKVGELFDGQPIYRFRYKGLPKVHVGLMAQDVERVRPDAVTEYDGIKFVNYDRATDRAAAFSRYTHA
jgi:Chaperone of endosialidase